MQKKIAKIKSDALKEIEAIKDKTSLEAIEKKYFSRKSGIIFELFKDLKKLSGDTRPKMGALLNKTRDEIENAVKGKMKGVMSGLAQEAEERDWLDVSVSIDKYRLGHLHPMTQVQYELEDIFSELGFTIEDGPELESDFFNFEALNIPEWHPARDDQDTFYIPQKNKESARQLLRTHTSPVQIRAMKKYGAPLRVAVPGRVFRNEATDASHDHTFYQLEGVMVDKEVSIAHLVAVMKEAISAIFDKEVTVRLRPGYFPFVEPGVEMDFQCLLCGGKGCSVCKQTGWVEFLGAGLMHPKVLKAGGIDPTKWQGFAFGMGITRLVMMKYGIDDIRLLQSADLRFLNQF